MISGSYQVSFNKNSNMKIYNSIFFLPAFLLMAACNSGTPTEEAGHGETEEQHEKDILTLTESQITPISIKASPIYKHHLGTSLTAKGTLEVHPENDAKESAKIAGTVRQKLVQQGKKKK